MNTNRLLLLTPDFPPNHGGVARYLSRLTDYFSSRIFVITSVHGAWKTSPFTVIEQQLLSPFFWPHWLVSVRSLILLRQTYDIVLTSHLLPFGTAAWLAKFITKKNYVVIVHGMDVRLASKHFIKKYIAQIVLKNALVVVANSQALSQEVAETFGVALPLVVYPCLEKTAVEKQAKHQVETLLPPSTTIRFLTVSRLIERKGHVQVLMALSELKRLQAIPVFHYDIVGEGPMEQTLKELVGQLHLDEVEFHGAVSDDELDQFYEKADIFIMPVHDNSVDKEGFGYVFLEAASFEIPSISTRISGVDEAIVDNETGLLVSANDQEDLRRVISELANNLELRQRLGKNAKIRAEQNFTCDQQFSKLELYL